MNIKHWMITGTCALLMLGGSAFAEEEDTRPPREDGDKVKRDGGKGRRGPGGEGRKGHRPPPFNEILERHDANEDGILQISEKPERMPEHMFDKLDANGDSAIDASEAKKAREMHRKGKKGGRRGPRGPEGALEEGDGDMKRGRRGPDGEGGRRGERERPSADELFDMMDANGDGVVDRAEAKKFQENRGGRRGGKGRRGEEAPAE